MPENRLGHLLEPNNVKLEFFFFWKKKNFKKKKKKKKKKKSIALAGYSRKCCLTSKHPHLK